MVRPQGHASPTHNKELLRIDSDEQIILWFGAGVSFPSGMPSAARFVKRWLEHLLPAEAVNDIWQLFETHGTLIGKTVPRMEKVIEDGVLVYGETCLELLKFFEDIVPNSDHRRIAGYLHTKKAWAITTNFDTGIEKAEGAIPVHTPNSQLPEEWGLVKLHGSIQDPLPMLGHSIRNLVRGIVPHLRMRLVTLLSQPKNVHVFVGYSGSDFFDVIPFFREMSTPQRSCRAIWVDHAKTSLHQVPIENLADGPRTMLEAFQNYLVVKGDTSEALESLLRISVKEESIDAEEWHAQWPGIFSPSPVNAWLYAAKLFASLGMGTKSYAACRNAYRAGIKRTPEFEDLVANALRDSGRYDAELIFRDRMAHAPAGTALGIRRARHRAAALRLAARTIQAWRAYDALEREVYTPRPTSDDIATQYAWAIAEAGLFYRDFLIRLPQSGLMAFLVKPLTQFFTRRVRRTVVAARNLLLRTPYDPHLIATLQRLELVISTFGAGGVPLRDYKEILQGKAQPTAPTAFGFGENTEALYAETDSILGRVNALREQARFLERLVDRRLIHGPKDANNSVMQAALDAASRSFTLAKVIDDVPGALKGAELCMHFAKRLGQPDRERWVAEIAIGRQQLADRRRRLPEGFDDLGSSS